MQICTHSDYDGARSIIRKGTGQLDVYKRQVLMEEPENDGAWIQIWKRALDEYQATE